ncbi:MULTISPECIES: hypothetical protein [Roseinatronobacter]|uniref:Uncharacterized protein n=1 Tax=Roseinatronobacter domitianus TaxID=2940293 RepID=A0ABT0LY53_9RHOB|nr:MULTISPECIES: hypothetical protein [Roseibaca]MCL1627537.1 hypothetical protein [Roseibaca domitiana]
MKPTIQTPRPSLALEAILSIKGMPRRLSDRYTALELERDEALPKRGHIRH